MSNTIRIKRKLTGSTAPTTANLVNAELAFNEADEILYYGKAGNASAAGSVITVGGSGAFAALGSSHTFTTGVTSTYASGSFLTIASGSTFTIAGTWKIDSTTVSLSGDELNVLDSVTPGTAANSKALVVDASRNITNVGSINLVTITNPGTAATLTIANNKTLTVSNTLTFTGTDASSVAFGAGGTVVYTTTALSSLAAAAADVAFGGFKITGLGTPSAGTDAANKTYVDSVSQGLDVKASARAATTGNITLTGAQTIDGVVVGIGDRVLVKNQSAGAENGIYVVATGSWTRATDADLDYKVTAGMFTFVEEGDTNADSGWVMTTNGTITIGTTALTFAQFSGAGAVVAGAGLTKSGNTLDVATASTARIVVNADNIDLASGVITSTGTYKSVTVDTYGRVTAGTNPTTLTGYGITDAQPIDATLTALAGVTTAADQLIYATGADTFAVTAFTTYGRSLVDDADASTARSTLGLGTMATQAASSVAITGGTIDNITIDGGSF